MVVFRVTLLIMVVLCSGGSNLPINITSSINYSFKLIDFCKGKNIDVNIARVSYLQVFNSDYIVLNT